MRRTCPPADPYSGRGPSAASYRVSDDDDADGRAGVEDVTDIRNGVPEHALSDCSMGATLKNPR